MAKKITVKRSNEQLSIDRMASWVSAEVDAKTDPLCLSFATLKRMDTNPMVYLAERALVGLVTKPDNFHIQHPGGSKTRVAETEEYLWPLMAGGLLSAIARAYVYGSIPYLLELERGEFIIRVPTENPKKGAAPLRKKTLNDFWRYTASFELRPDRVTIETDRANRIVRLKDLTTGEVYDPGQGRVAVWDMQFGEWQGQGARRRAWPETAKSSIFDLLQARYLERTVHSPVVIYAPGEDMKAEGEEEPISVGEYISEQLENLMGGGFMNLPNDTDAQGKRLFELQPLTLPERSEVFDRALNRFDARVCVSYLVPPAMGAAVEDTLGGGAARVLKDLFATFVEGLMGFVARELTQVVQTIDRLNHNARTELLCEVKALEIPDKVQKLYLDVLGKVGEAARLGERVDVDKLLNYLNVPVREDSPAEGGAQAEEGAQPGRPRSPTGDREKRREDAETDQGAEDTGGETVDGEEREGARE